ncbi:sulfur transferase domain-containing protein [uncultured Luteimonas sp.]|uniref:tyrosine-protein phosphatase n=1 Tax=uncultured Luteimonas sp. TaxID=453144 RepID=UPI0026272712|nr:sulfur transferase domain-containing protein [uncultured Luteimonas sp.]
MRSPNLASIQAALLTATLILLTSCAATPETADAPKPGPGIAAAPESPLTRFHTPSPGLHTGGRITADDLPALRAAGITRVIDLTRDAETPAFDEATAVRAAGLAYDNLPISGATDLNRQSVAAFDQLLRGTQGPTLVHCASGNRVGALAALRAAWLQGADEEAAIAEGQRWGLRSLEGEVRTRLARERCVAAAQGQQAVEACAAGG